MQTSDIYQAYSIYFVNLIIAVEKNRLRQSLKF